MKNRVGYLLAGLGLAAATGWAIQTGEVELGRSGSYDGGVGITRDTEGRMLFFDRELTEPASLYSLWSAGNDHHWLAGLEADDHPQYLLRADLASEAALEAQIGVAVVTANDPEVTLGSAGDVLLRLNADTDNVQENDNPRLELIQDGGAVRAAVGLVGDAGEILAGSVSNALYLNNEYAAPICLATANLIRLAVLENGKVRIGTPGPVGAATQLKVADGAIEGQGLKLTSPAYPAQSSQAEFLTHNTDPAANWGGIGGYTDGSTWQRALDYKWWVQGASAAPGLHLSATGLGVGKLAPARMLDVAGSAALAGDLDVGSGGNALRLNGQRLVNPVNLLDNPDFNLWQRGTVQTCAAGGNAAATLTWPVPGTLTLVADRWQISRAGTAMTATVSRIAPPAGLATARWALRLQATAGAPCRQYVHQTLSRLQTRALRGGWVTFAISHYLEGAGGTVTVAIYKTVGGTPVELTRMTCTGAANQWERLTVAAPVPDDAETVLFSIQPELSAGGGPAAACLANATAVAGRYAGAAGERATNPALAALPPLARDPAGDLAACQAYYEKGQVIYSSYAPDSATYLHAFTAGFNTAKAGPVTVALGTISASPLAVTSSTATAWPAYVEGESWPQAIRLILSGNVAVAAAFTLSADWTATVPEPL